MTTRTLLAFALAMLAADASAVTVTGAKIARVRVNDQGIFSIDTTIDQTGCRTTTTENYIFDGKTDQGRLLFTSAIVAFATQSLVDVNGSGSCIAGIAGGLSENMTGLTIR